ncbi:MAG: hypothetical protein ACAH59_11045 [Pseudobdellovibrionaceae bacterium]
MRHLFFVVSLFSSLVLADMKPGAYQGLDQSGKACKFTLGEGWFEDNLPHPLNERVPVSGIGFEGQTLDQAVWNVAHPPQLDVQEGRVRFNHDSFTQIVATPFGAVSVVLLKDSAESSEGHKPSGLVYIEDHYKNATDSKKLTCTL